jgi:hypothetical protein
MAVLFWKEILREVTDLWWRILPWMYLGYFLAFLVKDTDFFQNLSWFVAPLAGLGNLSDKSGAFLVLCFINPVAAYAMLGELKNESEVGEQEVIVSLLVASLPKALYAIVFFMGLVILSSLGLKVGTLYIVAYLLIAVLASGFGFILGKVTLSSSCALIKGSYEPSQVQNFKLKERLGRAFKQGSLLFLRTAKVLLPFTFLAVALLKLDFVNDFFLLVKPVFHFLNLPAQAFLIVSIGTISSIGALASLAPLVKSQVLNPIQTVITLLIALFFHRLFEFWRHELPLNISIFGAKLGGKASLLLLFCRELATFIVLSGFIFISYSLR